MKKWLLPHLIIATVISVFCILKFCVDTSPPTDQEAQAIFDRDEALLLAVKAYFEGLNKPEQYGRICWDLDSPSGSYGHIPPENSPITSVMEQMEDRGYQTILRDENTVEFLFRNRGADVGCRIVYAAERKDINIDYLTACTPLTENWYYCVSDFNEWRIRSTAESVPTREGDK